MHAGMTSDLVKKGTAKRERRTLIMVTENLNNEDFLIMLWMGSLVTRIAFSKRPNFQRFESQWVFVHFSEKNLFDTFVCFSAVPVHSYFMFFQSYQNLICDDVFSFCSITTKNVMIDNIIKSSITAKRMQFLTFRKTF